MEVNDRHSVVKKTLSNRTTFEVVNDNELETPRYRDSIILYSGSRDDCYQFIQGLVYTPPFAR